MGGQPFGIGKGNSGGADSSQGGFVKLQEAGPLHKVQHGKPAGKARAAPGGQNVIGSGDIIANRFRRMAAKEGAACVADVGEHGVGIVDGDFDVFRR